VNDVEMLEKNWKYKKEHDTDIVKFDGKSTPRENNEFYEK
jgi:hypothetical protein